jgi:hypothetical protein
MVQVVGYGAVPAASARQLSPIARRSGFIRFAAAATLAVGALAAVIVIGQNRPVELGMAAINEEGYGGPVGDMGSTNNVDTLKNIWFDDTEAWEGIDEILPTEGGAWEDQNEPDVGYAFKGQGSVTSDDGWTGYYDTTLHDGTDREVLPMDNFNDALGWDPALAGGNALWGDRGGQNVDNPAPWRGVHEPLTVQQFSDSDWVPYGYTLGGPSHSSVADGGK